LLVVLAITVTRVIGVLVALTLHTCCQNLSVVDSVSLDGAQDRRAAEAGDTSCGEGRPTS
jgi:hypothetical protein